MGGVIVEGGVCAEWKWKKWKGEVVMEKSRLFTNLSIRGVE